MEPCSLVIENSFVPNRSLRTTPTRGHDIRPQSIDLMTQEFDYLRWNTGTCSFRNGLISSSWKFLKPVYDSESLRNKNKVFGFFFNMKIHHTHSSSGTRAHPFRNTGQLKYRTHHILHGLKWCEQRFIIVLHTHLVINILVQTCLTTHCLASQGGIHWTNCGTTAFKLILLVGDR